jgi:hypothetical protein
VIRRLSAAAVAVVLTSTVASGCSTFTKNKEAAKVDSTSLSVDDFQTISDDFVVAGQIGAPASGEYQGTDQRNILTRWVFSQLLAHQLVAAGTPIDAKARSAAEASLQQQAADKWGPLHPVTKAFLIDELAAQNVLTTSAVIPDADVEAAYDAGIGKSNTLCLRVIGFTDPTKANDAYEQILGGTPFADVADANNGDASIGAGGVFTNSTTNSECSSASSLNAQIAQSLAQLPLNTPSAPITLTGSDGSQQYYVFLQRPWSEVADAAKPLVRQALVPATARGLIAGGHAYIDSRYGMWNPDALEVTPSR